MPVLSLSKRPDMVGTAHIPRHVTGEASRLRERV